MPVWVRNTSRNCIPPFHRAGSSHKAVDVVCDDYAAVNAPFSGTLGGPVSRTQGDALHYDGVKLYNSGRSCEIGVQGACHSLTE